MKPSLVPGSVEPIEAKVVPFAGKPAGGKGKRRSIDWEKAERLYCAGRLSLREIAGEVGCGHAAIIARAKRLGWTRDVSAKANALARSMVIADQAPEQLSTIVSTNTAKNDRAAAVVNAGQVEQEAGAIAAVSRRHLADIGRARGVVAGLLDDLAFVAQNRGAFQEMAAEMAAEGGAIGQAQRRAAMLAAVSLGSHAATVDKLGNCLKNLIALERQAYGMKDQTEKPDSLDALLTRLAEERRRTIDVTPA